MIESIHTNQWVNRSNIVSELLADGTLLVPADSTYQRRFAAWCWRTRHRSIHLWPDWTPRTVHPGPATWDWAGNLAPDRTRSSLSCTIDCGSPAAVATWLTCPTASCPQSSPSGGNSWSRTTVPPWPAWTESRANSLSGRQSPKSPWSVAVKGRGKFQMTRINIELKGTIMLS